jgi:sialate O-acetylesterase
MKICNLFPALFLFANVFAGAVASADVTLSPLIANNMVLQRDTQVPIWGKAAFGEKVTVKFLGQTRSATAGKDGRWEIKLNPLKAGGPYEMTLRGRNTIVLKNILVGEVWVASGQSNMDLFMLECLNADKEVSAAKYSRIRLFTVDHTPAAVPTKDLTTRAYGFKALGWNECSPESVPYFSGIAYFFGRKLHKDLNVPIGLINSSWGGSNAETWTPIEAFNTHPSLRPLHPEFCMPNDNGLPGKYNSPTALYNGMIYPLIPYAIRGAIWYQGESNDVQRESYSVLLTALIEGWRKAWGRGDFPFLIVQLANYRDRRPEPTDCDWAHFRAGQARVAREVKNTGLIVTIDIGAAATIHPKNKQAVGHRLALAAEYIAYGRKIPYSGPVYRSMTQEANRIRIKFDHTDGGLVARGDKLEGFAVAGENKKFVWAQARIEGDTVVVWSDTVSKPIAVRYAWADNPAATLYNAADLPAVPFRTDGW